MNRAVAASRLVFLERALRYPRNCEVEKVTTLAAQAIPVAAVIPMIVLAIELQHGLDGLFLPVKPAASLGFFFLRHGLRSLHGPTGLKGLAPRHQDRPMRIRDVSSRYYVLDTWFLTPFFSLFARTFGIGAGLGGFLRQVPQ